MFVPLAHPGHWLAELMYVAPVLAIVIWIGVKSIMDRRRPDEPEA
jgi:hypothetical protein